MKGRLNVIRINKRTVKSIVHTERSNVTGLGGWQAVRQPHPEQQSTPNTGAGIGNWGKGGRQQ